MGNTRIVATIGPATCNPKSLLSLNAAGANIFRLNGSHSDLNWHQDAIDLIHEVLPEAPILLDIPGRKIRTTKLRVEPTFAIGSVIIITTDLSHDGSEKVPVNYDNLPCLCL